MNVLFDSNGYPDSPELERLTNFYGYPRDYVEKASSLFWKENTDYGRFVTDRGKVMYWFSVKSGGWSGHQTVVDIITSSFFHRAYWFQSERGGLHVYHIPGTDWDGYRGFWGNARIAEPV